MATYIQLGGVKIPIVSSDPSNPENGQMWYNTTSGQLKGKLNSGVVVIAFTQILIKIISIFNDERKTKYTSFN